MCNLNDTFIILPRVHMVLM